MYDDGLDPDAPFDDDVWELYDVVADPSETNDLAAAEPERLAAMVELWWEEAARNDVLPLDNRPLFAIMNPRPTSRQDRSTYEYFPNGAPVPEAVAVNVRNRSHTITASITVPDGGRARGHAARDGLGARRLHVADLDGRLRYVHNLYGAQPRRRRERRRRRAGAARGRVRRSPRPPSSPGRGELLLDGARRRRGRHPALHADDLLATRAAA